MAWTLAVVFGCWSVAFEARADPSLRGALDGRGMFELSGRKGGLITTDLWWGNSLLSFGAVLGVGALSEGNGYSSGVLTPFGLSLMLQPLRDATGPTLVVRGGGYAGAQKSGLYVAPWASAALGYRFDLGEGASVRAGVDTWLLFGQAEGIFLGPYLGLGF